MNKSLSKLSGVGAFALAAAIILQRFAPNSNVIDLISGFLIGAAIVLFVVSIWFYSKTRKP